MLSRRHVGDDAPRWARRLGLGGKRWDVIQRWFAQVRSTVDSVKHVDLRWAAASYLMSVDPRRDATVRAAGARARRGRDRAARAAGAVAARAAVRRGGRAGAGRRRRGGAGVPRRARPA